MLEFSVGDSVVVPGAGIGVIEDIETVEMGAETIETYRVVVEHANLRVWVPVVSAESQGYRGLVTVETVAKLLEMIRSTKSPLKRATWNRRQRRYTEQLMSNDPMELAKLLGELADVRQGKALSFGERRMFDRASDLMVSELKEAAKDPAVVAERFKEALAA